MDSLDLVEAELAALEELEERQGAAKAKAKSNPLLLGLSPYAYMVRCLRLIKAPELEQALLLLPFHYIARMVSMLLQVRTGK